jgi:hypothetical protein
VLQHQLAAVTRDEWRSDAVVSCSSSASGVCPALAIDAIVIIDVLGHSRRLKTDSAASLRVGPPLRSK